MPGGENACNIIFIFTLFAFKACMLTLLKVNKNQLMGNTKTIHVLTTAMFLC